jgi:hypothetical protein
MLRGVHLGQRLDRDRVAGSLEPLRLSVGSRDLALIPVEDPDRQADAEADRVVATDTLVLDLGRDVPPGVCPREPDVRLTLFASGVGGAQVRPVGERTPIEVGLSERDVPEGEVSDDLEFLCDPVRSDRCPQRNLRCPE